MAEIDDKDLNVVIPDNLDEWYGYDGGVDNSGDNTDTTITKADLTERLIEIKDAVDRLYTTLQFDYIHTTDTQKREILNTLSIFDTTYVNNITEYLQGEAEQDGVVDDEGVDLPDMDGKYYYGLGEKCLLIDPFDNYRMFTLYLDSETKTPLDLRDGQVLYLVFRSGSKEVRIREYQPGPYINIKRENGQVLFKITKKQASDIINLRNRNFYVTRVYESYDPSTDSIISSDEEVIYSGFWGERNSEKESEYLSTINGLKDVLKQRTSAMNVMIDSINELTLQNTEFAEKIEELKSQLDKKDAEMRDLEDKLNDAYPGWMEAIGGYDNAAEIIDSQTVLIDYSKADEETKEYLDNLTGSNISRTSLNNLQNLVR